MPIRALGGELLVLIVLAAASACRGATGGLFKQYEYEEDMYLSLDGSATIYVNSSVVAFNALRGTSFDTGPTARIDREVREYFETPVTHVTRLSRPSRRNNRRFIHVRLDVPDVRRLREAPPFAWSAYEFTREDPVYLYRQTVGPPAGAGPVAGLTGQEIVAFRLHLPSKIVFHNTGTAPGRGNILVWEQSLRDRLQGVPLMLDARMETQSILYRTLRLFGATFVAVACTFGLVIWWILRRGARAAEREVL